MNCSSGGFDARGMVDRRQRPRGLAVSQGQLRLGERSEGLYRPRASDARRSTVAQGTSISQERRRRTVAEVSSDPGMEEDNSSLGCKCRTLKVSPSPKSQSSKNRCRCPYGECLQPQKGVAPPCLTETQTISNQRSSGNFGVNRGLGWWRGRKRFGMAGCLMKHLLSIQSSPGVLLWANDFVL